MGLLPLGCIHTRQYDVVSARDIGFPVVTQNHYKFVGYKSYSENGDNEEYKARSEAIYMTKWNREFGQCLPDVFRDDGLPFTIHEVDVKSGGGIDMIPIPIIYGFILPDLQRSQATKDYLIEIEQNGTKISTPLRHTSSYSHALCTWPIAYLFYNGTPDLPETKAEERCSYSRHANSFFGKELFYSEEPAYTNFSLFAYGIAVKLKELEDAGKITKPFEKVPYRIIKCKREDGNDFSYVFSLEMADGHGTLAALRNVQKELRSVIQKDYLEKNSNVDRRTVVVDFPDFQLDEGRIEGRAIVLQVNVTRQEYDPDTRIGKLAMRINPNQLEESRRWIRKNIESLVREKNVALAHGSIPANARFYLGREELKGGNVLEIEFKTE